MIGVLSKDNSVVRDRNGSSSAVGGVSCSYPRFLPKNGDDSNVNICRPPKIILVVY